MPFFELPLYLKVVVLLSFSPTRDSFSSQSQRTRRLSFLFTLFEVPVLKVQLKQKLSSFVQVDKLRQQADDQESTLVAQEEEVQGKKHELESLKEEEKTLLEDIKKTEKELTKLEQNLNIAQELRREVFTFFALYISIFI